MTGRTDAGRLVKLFGGPTQLAETLNKEKEVSVSVKAVNMWIFRKHIPAKWVLILMGISNKNGISFTMSDYDLHADVDDILS